MNVSFLMFCELGEELAESDRIKQIPSICHDLATKEIIVMSMHSLVHCNVLITRSTAVREVLWHI